jgi:hypothetical protein
MREWMAEVFELLVWTVCALVFAGWMLSLTSCASSTQPECVSDCWLITFADDTQRYGTNVWYDATSWYVYDECAQDTTTYSKQDVRLVAPTGECE